MSERKIPASLVSEERLFCAGVCANRGLWVWRSAALVVSLLLGGTAVLPPVASAQPAERIETLAATLPWEAAGLAVVSTGSQIYLIGGMRNRTISNAITRFDPASGAFTEEGVTLPGARYSATALWTGKEILVFGGATGVGEWNDTLRFNPSTKVLRYGANMTSSRSHAPAVWTGRYAYIFGGTWGSIGLWRDILRYDPGADSMTVVPDAELPGSPRFTSGAWDGRHAVVFGSIESPAFAFDPTSELVSTISGFGVMPGVIQGSAVQIGSYAYAFGGWDPLHAKYTANVLRYRTGSTEWAFSNESLSRPLGLTAAVAMGNRAYIFGGWDGVAYSDMIQVFRSFQPQTPVPWIGIAFVVIAVAAALVVVWSLPPKRRKSEKAVASRKE